MKLFILLGVLSLALQPATIFSAEFEGEKYLLLKGEIEVGDYEKLVTKLKSRGDIFLQLNSPGGDLYEAIKIGRLVRSALLGVAPNGKCWSACALILIADATESVRFWNNVSPLNIAFHRGYLSPKVNRNLTFRESLQTHEKISTDMRSYLKEMEVETWVIEKILDQSSQEAWVLNRQEIQQVFKEWSGLEEWLIAKCGSMSDAEDSDRRLVSSVDELRSGKLTPEQANAATFGAYGYGGKNWNDKYDSFSPAYKSYLNEKMAKIWPCRKSAEETHRREVIASLR